MEEKHPISFAPGYFITKSGKIYGIKNEQPISYITSKGYLEIIAKVGNRRQRMAVHRIVLTVFKGPPPSKYHECAHWDGNKQNNHIDNLRWVTKQENTQDRIRHKTLPKGDKHYKSIFNDKHAAIIVKIYPLVSAKNLSNYFGIKQKPITDIAMGRNRYDDNLTTYYNTNKLMGKIRQNSKKIKKLIFPFLTNKISDQI